jgi:hypothetical protein
MRVKGERDSIDGAVGNVLEVGTSAIYRACQHKDGEEEKLADLNLKKQGSHRTFPLINVLGIRLRNRYQSLLGMLHPRGY